MTTSTLLLSEQGSHPSADEQYISVFYCKALYDYQTTDASSLSFRKGQIIEVLTKLESGWWDGLLDDERGWFPSNYVTVISDAEAEALLNGPDYSIPQSSIADDSMVDMAHSMSRALSQSDSDGEWLQAELEYTGQSHINGNGVQRPTVSHSDFWVPQVSTDGRVSGFLDFDGNIYFGGSQVLLIYARSSTLIPKLASSREICHKKLPKTQTMISWG